MQNGDEYPRLLKAPKNKSFFLFGPRGTGKTSWTRQIFPEAIYIDLLESDTYAQLLGSPHLLESLIPPHHDDWVVIDEVQKLPALLNEVHRLIEKRKIKFVLTGSSARSLRKKGVNLLAGRAVQRKMHPLSAVELGKDFSLERSLRYGQLPSAQTEEDPQDYLNAYVATYLREEVLQEGLTRNLAAFTRFLETASLSQGSVLNVSSVARECALERKTVTGYFELAEDLLIAHRLPVFTKRARRQTVAHPKFYFFDTGVYRSLRPRGPLDSSEELDGAGLETLVFQELQAINDSLLLEYKLFYWQLRGGLEVDFVLYGPNGLHAIEVKRSASPSLSDLRGLKAFAADYPESTLTLLYGGTKERWQDGVHFVPLAQGLKTLPKLLSPGKL